MKERPILFTTDMVRAILDGRKTQTRRLKFKCEPGDLLWVRESWNRVGEEGGVYLYKADGEDQLFSWKPSIHMPRDAARLFLRVEKTWQERLQDISYEDALEEGIESTVTGIPPYDLVYMLPRNPNYYYTHKQAFQALWDSNAKRGFGWDTNPLVAVIQFKVEKII
jgi:hypothetical protein